MLGVIGYDVYYVGTDKKGNRDVTFLGYRDNLDEAMKIVVKSRRKMFIFPSPKFVALTDGSYVCKMKHGEYQIKPVEGVMELAHQNTIVSSMLSRA